MSREQRPAFISVQGTSLTIEEKAIIKDLSPIGFALFSRNIVNKTQLKKLIESIQNTLEREDIFFGIDQEGGRVRRLVEPEFNAYASQETLGRLYQEISPQIAQEATRLHAALISQDLRSCGLNMNFTPVLDIQYPQTAPVLKSRCFSTSEKIVTELGKIMVEEYIHQGIIPCVKHLPGHGRIAEDPHLETPKISATIEELKKDFYPFQKLSAICPCGMSAHIVLETVDNKNPITQSKQGIKKIIRKEIGFDGFLISDSINMNALHGTIAERAQSAISAGCDAYCYCGGEIKELKELTQLNDKLSLLSQKRLIRLKNILNSPLPETSIDYKIYEKIIGKIDAYKDTYDATAVLERMKNR